MAGAWGSLSIWTWTATLFGAACEAAALIASRDDQTVQLTRNFGLDMGIAFQIHDDYLGAVGLDAGQAATLQSHSVTGSPGPNGAVSDYRPPQ